VSEETSSDRERPRGLIVNSAWMFIAQSAATVAGGAVSIYAIRHFSTLTWGHYSTAFALVAIFTVVAGPGISTLALREMSEDGDPRSLTHVFATACTAILLAGVVAIVLLFAVFATLGYGRDVIVIGAIASPFLFLDPVLALVQAAFNARRLLFYVAWFQVVRSCAYCAVGFIVVAAGGGTPGLAMANVSTSLLGLIVALTLFRSRLHARLRLSMRIHDGMKFLRAALPIAGIGIVGIVYDRLDVIMLSKLGTSQDVARYTVPYNLVRLTWIIPSVIAAAFYPLLSHALQHDFSEARRLFLLVVRVFLFLSVPISLALALGSSTIVPFVFGSRYAASASVLAILVWTSVLGFQNYVLWYGILAIRKERAVLWIQLAGLVVNATTNVLLIPRYGPKGAAASLVASDLVVVVGQAILINRHLFELPLWRIAARPLLAGAAVIPLAYLTASQSPLGGAAVAAFGYVVLLLAMRYITPTEWQPVLRRARRLFSRGSRAASPV
jgi:O-antigen/teichoic acid export membrane protein